MSQTPPIAGYSTPTTDKVAEVNINKHLEELTLRRIDEMMARAATDSTFDLDLRWLAIARTHIQEGFMALNRAIFQPARVEGPLGLDTLIERVAK